MNQECHIILSSSDKHIVEKKERGGDKLQLHGAVVTRNHRINGACNIRMSHVKMIR